MNKFGGFSSGKVRSVTLPEPVLSELVPLIDDLAELKVTLHVLWRLGRQRGRVCYLHHADLASDRVLLSGLGAEPAEALEAGLARAVERGTLLHVEAPSGESPGGLYFANTPRGRAAARAVGGGEWPAELEPAARPNIFALYEQNVGLLTPLIADELREAEQTYPAEWVEDAFREAVSHNKRNWRYIRAILERWRSEGRGGKQKPQRSIDGEYGEYVKH